MNADEVKNEPFTKEESATCKRGHVFYSGLVWCPICEVYDDFRKDISYDQRRQKNEGEEK